MSHAAILRAIRALLPDGHGEISMQAIADRAGVSRRSVIRIMPDLERSGVIRRDGGERRVNVIHLVTRDESRAVSPVIGADGRCAGLPPLRVPPGLARHFAEGGDEPPGDEYTDLVNVDAATRDRALYCHRVSARTGRQVGPAWLRELGARLAGEAPR